MLPQSVFAPIVASIADTFQLRKSLIIIFCLIAFVGAAIAPGSKDIYRLIAAQTLVGFGFVVMPLAQVIPSEILPRKWRPSKPCTNMLTWKLLRYSLSGPGLYQRWWWSWCHCRTHHHRSSDQGQCTSRLADFLCMSSRKPCIAPEH